MIMMQRLELKKNARLGSYLTTLRIQSGAPSVSAYISGLNSTNKLNISESYYRAIESGDKLPAVETVADLADALGADRYVVFQHYLKDMLPPDIFEKLVEPVTAEVPFTSAKEVIERKDEIIASYRAALQRSYPKDDAAGVYAVDDAIALFLDANFKLLPLIHFVYMTEGDITEEELYQVCKANRISYDINSILDAFRKYNIAKITMRNGSAIVRRFDRVFRLPRTATGRAVRARWILAETEKGLADERSNMVETNRTFSHAVIDCYRQSQLERINDRILDLLAQLNAAGTIAEDKEACPFFVSVTLSPRPEYLPVPAARSTAGTKEVLHNDTN